jgi:hypothetical protein
MWGLRNYFHEQQERHEMDAFVTAKLSQEFRVPLDCPPLGRQNVVFVPDDANPDVTGYNAPWIQEQWGNIWPGVYRGILNETSDWTQEEKQMLVQKVEIKVDLPDKLLVNGVTWQVEYDCEAGYFITDMNGYTVGETQIGN